MFLITLITHFGATVTGYTDGRTDLTQQIFTDGQETLKPETVTTPSPTETFVGHETSPIRPKSTRYTECSRNLIFTSNNNNNN